METERRVQRAGVSPPYWIITRSEELSIEFSGRRRRSEAYREILTLRAEGSKVLPLFGSEEQASSFVEAFVSYTGEGGWRITQVWAGELLMLLSAGGSGVGPCSGVSAVTFDPPEESTEGDLRELETLGKRCFMDQLLGRGDRWWRGR